ncbi:MAG TPA: hypothetical protein VF950_15415 [Planctomycetota bacterium]
MARLPLAALVLLTGCPTVSPHGPAQTAYRVAYFSSETEPVRAAVLRIFERWKVRINSDDGRIVQTRPFTDGPSTWKMQVDIEHSAGTTAVLVRMDILRGGTVDEPDVVVTDYESIVRWQIGGDPDAYVLPARPTHIDTVRAELVDWLKRWRAGKASVSAPDEEERARNRRELFLGSLRMMVPP